MFLRMLVVVYLCMNALSAWMVHWHYTHGKYALALWHAFCLGALLTASAQGLFNLWQCSRTWRKIKSP